MTALIRVLGHPLIELESTTSTMEEVRLRANDSPEGLTVVARRQTAGRGRGTNDWQDVPGSSLLFSTLLLPRCPVERFQLFPVAAGLAIAESLTELYGIGAQLKWPNDLLIDERKLAGILVTSRVKSGTVHSAVIGVGLNVLAVPPGLESKAIALASVVRQPVERTPLLDRMLAHLGTLYSAILSGDSSSIVDRWNERAIWRGQEVTAGLPQGEVRGVLRGIDDTGRLQIENREGQLLSLVTGAVRRGVAAFDQ